MKCVTFSSKVELSTSSLNRGGCFLLTGGYTGGSQVLFKRGAYKIELWGGAGGNTTYVANNIGGYGGYASGIILVTEPKIFYFLIGTEGQNSNKGVPGAGGLNSGIGGAIDNVNNDCASGGSGGSTDMRLLAEDIGSYKTIYSRVMVAGGGGSGGCFTGGGKGGNSGGTIGEKGDDNGSKTKIGGNGGSQVSGHSIYYGGPGLIGNEAGGSGGGGYWGGYGGQSGNSTAKGGSGGGGGSSYVSGHSECVAMNNETGEPLENSIHPSLTLFVDPIIIPGGSEMPVISNDPLLFESQGHRGSGAARITAIVLESNPSTLSCPLFPYYTIIIAAFINLLCN